MSKYFSNSYYIDHKKLLRDLNEADKRKIEKIIKREHNLFKIEDERSRRLRNKSSSPTRKMRESPRRLRNRSSSPTRKMRESSRRIKYTENELLLIDELEKCKEENKRLNIIIQQYEKTSSNEVDEIIEMGPLIPKRPTLNFVELKLFKTRQPTTVNNNVIIFDNFLKLLNEEYEKINTYILTKTYINNEDKVELKELVKILEETYNHFLSGSTASKNQFKSRYQSKVNNFVFKVRELIK